MYVILSKILHLFELNIIIWEQMYLCVSSCGACSWGHAEEHRGDESHAEPSENPRNPGHHEGAIKGDDEGLQQHLK